MVPNPFEEAQNRAREVQNPFDGGGRDAAAGARREVQNPFDGSGRDAAVGARSEVQNPFERQGAASLLAGAQDGVPEPELRLRDDTYLGALGFPQYIAALHIVLFHCYDSKNNSLKVGLPHSTNWLSWGQEWVPFFFMLSGFKLTWTRYIRPDPMPQDSTLVMWWTSVWKLYPAYFLSEVLGFWNNKGLCMTLWPSVVPSLLLINSWGWQYDCYHLDKATFTVSDRKVFCVAQINEPAWYLCALHFFYIVFNVIYVQILKLSSFALKFLAVVCYLFSLFWSLEFRIFKNYTPEKPEGLPMTVASTLASFNPLSRLNEFVLGMCLCRWFVDEYCSKKPSDGKKYVDLDKVEGSRYWAKWAVTAAYLLLLVLFNVVNSADFVLPINFILSGGLAGPFGIVIYPLYALLILGLCFELDPLSRLFKMRPFVWGDTISYEIYVLQIPVFGMVRGLSDFMKQQPKGGLSFGAVLAVYPFVLHAIAMLVHYWVQVLVVKQYLPTVKKAAVHVSSWMQS